MKKRMAQVQLSHNHFKRWRRLFKRNAATIKTYKKGGIVFVETERAWIKFFGGQYPFVTLGMLADGEGHGGRWVQVGTIRSHHLDGVTITAQELYETLIFAILRHLKLWQTVTVRCFADER